MVEKICNCCNDTQIAYVIDKVDNDINTKKNITIIDYINNKNLQKKVKKEIYFLVCENKNELIKYESNIKKSHFKHKNCQYTEMSEWHKNWQNIFDISKREIIIGNRRADVCIENNVIEFQYSKIKKDMIDMRNKNYTINNKKIFWVIECEKDIKIIENDKEIKIEFTKNFWKYESFKNCEEIFLDNKNNIYKINPKKVKNNFISINIKKTKDDFINSLKYDVDIWDKHKNIELGNIYINQRGAGCGKTYESIQLKNDDRFKNKEYFIYLTKMNSAVSIIHKEFTEQYERGDLKIDLDVENEINEDIEKDYIGIKQGKKKIK